MNPRLLALLMRRFQAPAGDDGSVVDRGDNHVVTDDAQDAAVREATKAKEESDSLAEQAKVDAAKDKTKSDEDETDEEKEEREAEEAKAAEDAKKTDTKGKRIPLERHEAVLRKEREIRADLERQVADLKKGGAVAATNADITKVEESIKGWEREYNKMLADGELDKASDLMTKIRLAERDISEAKSEMRNQVTEARAYERVRYDNIVERLSAAYPVLDPSHADHDQALVDEVLERKDYYQSRGMSPGDALQKAAEKELGVSTVKQKTAVTADVRVDKADVAAERKKEAVERNLKVAGKQPADLSKVGLDSDKAGGSLTARDAIKLNHKDFSNLDEAQLSKMRGDTV